MTAISATLFRAIIWAIAGASYGLIYFSMLSYFGQSGAAWWHPIIAACCAGALVAAAYSAKRVAIVGLLVGSIISHLHIAFAADASHPRLLLGITAVVGFVAGVIASWVFERRHGALLVVSAGGVGGIFGGSAIVVLTTLLPFLDTPALVSFFLVPANGGLFYLMAIWAGRHRQQLVPHWLGVGIVSAGISMVAAVGLWLLSLTLRFDLDPALKTAVEAMFSTLPQAMAGGILGGAIGGVLLELFKVKWLIRL